MLKIYYSIRPDEANTMVLICTSSFKSIKETLGKNVLFQAKYLFLSGLDNRVACDHHLFQRSQGLWSALDILPGADSECRHKNHELDKFQAAQAI